MLNLVIPVIYKTICQTYYLAHVQEWHHKNFCDEVDLVSKPYKLNNKIINIINYQ